MVHKRSRSIITICMTLMLVFLLAFPVRVFAQDEAPTTNPDPVITVPTDAPVEPTAVVIEVPAEPTPVVTELPNDSLAEATQVPAEPTPVVTELPTEEAPVDMDVVAIKAVASIEVTSQEITEPDPVVMTAGETDLSEVIAALNEADALVVSDLGEPLALATKEAADILSGSDPFFWNGTKWVGYTKTGDGCPPKVTDCIQDDNPFNKAVSVAPGGTTIYVASGNYAEDVVINNSMLSFIGFQTITVPDANLPTTPTYTSGNALVNKITLNADFGTTSGVFANVVTVNAGGNIPDGIALASENGKVEVTLPRVDTCGVNKTCTEPTPQPLWSDGAVINANLYCNGGDCNDVRMIASTAPGTIYETECGEPNKLISLSSSMNMILMNPFNPIIKTYYGANSVEMLENLIIAVNVALRDDWNTNHYMERQVYWNILGRTGGSVTDTYSDEVNSIENGSNDTVLKNIGLYFVVSSVNNLGVTPDLEKQILFTKYCAPIVYGCTNPSSVNYNPDANQDDKSCKSTVPGCTNRSALNYNAGANLPDGSCIAKVPGCMDPAASNYDQSANVAGTCTYPSPKPKVFAPAPLFIPVTGNTCVPDVITAGIGHTCAVTPETGLRCWGQNDSGQLGDGSKKANSTIPIKVKVLDGGEVVQLVSGTKHTCALIAGNEVFCWGLNYSGQLGDGTNTNSNIPVKVKGLEGTIVSISAGENFTCAVNAANKTMCWGNNSGGQFKNGNTFSTSTPVVANLGSDIKLVSGGQGELQGVTNAGAVTFWSNQPAIPVTGLSSDVALVSADRFSEGGCAMTNEGKVECWGAITASEITDAKVPTELETGKKTCKVDPLITGEGHGCTITKDNGLVCWGKNVFGQLGNGTQKNSETPVEVTGIRNVLHLAAGFDHTCAIVDQETIKCWGQNTYGQLGNGTTKESSLPVLVK